jgi:hypothetical protein
LQLENLNLTVCHSVELLKAKFTKELLVVSQLTMVKVVKHTDAALLLTELAIQCYTHYLVVHLAMIASFLLNTSQWI